MRKQIFLVSMLVPDQTNPKLCAKTIEHHLVSHMGSDPKLPNAERDPDAADKITVEPWS